MFGNFQKRVQTFFGRLTIDAGKGTQTALTVNQDAGATGNLLDLQAGGVTQFRSAANGFSTFRRWVSPTKATSYIHENGYDSWEVFASGNKAATFRPYGCEVNSLLIGNSTLSQKTLLISDLSDILAQRGGVNPQEHRLYGSYTSATAYHRLSTKTLRQAITAAAGATLVSTISIPKYSHLIGVTTRVTTGLGVSGGTTGYQVGDGSDPDKWGDITGTAAGTTTDAANFTAVDALGPSASDRTITLTAVGGNFDGTGVIEVCAFYLRAEAD